MAPGRLNFKAHPRPRPSAMTRASSEEQRRTGRRSICCSVWQRSGDAEDRVLTASRRRGPASLHTTSRSTETWPVQLQPWIHIPVDPTSKHPSAATELSTRDPSFRGRRRAVRAACAYKHVRACRSRRRLTRRAPAVAAAAASYNVSGPGPPSAPALRPARRRSSLYRATSR